MQLQQFFFLLYLPTFCCSAETVLGVYIFSRHGDRTPKSLPPTSLTSLGYSQIFERGAYYRDRYIGSDAPQKIQGLNPDEVKLSQLAVSAPQDNVLMNSAQGFLQALYPPIGRNASAEKLRNSSTVEAPMEGYQLIPVSTVSSGTGSEDSAWLQGASNCGNAQTSSSQYYSSAEFKQLYDSTLDFYKGLTPVVNGTFREEEMSYKSAYSVFDLLHVALIHNDTLDTALLPNSTIAQLSSLAQTNEFSLAYNNTSPIRAIAGSVLAGEILASFDKVLSKPLNAPKLTVQFGAYATFLSFFGLSNLTTVSPDFAGIPDYACSMAFELFTTSAPLPTNSSTEYAEQDVSVRFLFHNGSSAATSDLTAYPLFGAAETELSFPAFKAGMEKFATQGQKQWCQACGNSTGVCESSAATASKTGDSDTKHGGISKAVAGVVGAMVALAVILGVELGVMLIGGLRVVKRRQRMHGETGDLDEKNNKGST